MNGVKGVAIVLLLVGFLFSLAYFDVGLTGKVVDANYIDSTDGVSNNLISVLISLNNLPSLDEFIFNWDGTDYSIYDDSLILMMNFEDDVNDVSSYSHDGEILGGVDFVDSKYSKGLNFSEGEGVNISAHEDFNVDEFTISLWVKKGEEKKVKQITVFGYTACMILESGENYCVGDNQYGQFGDGTTDSSFVFRKTLEDYEFDSFCEEDYSNSVHICGVLKNGTALCWGNNGFGKLGDGTTEQRTSPFPVLGNYNFSSLYCGRHNTCGLLDNGTAFCWGGNSLGQIGDNTTTNRYVPTPVYGDYVFSSLTTGDSEQCGLLENGSALCWGRNENGQVGSGNNDTTLIPTFVSGNHNFSKIVSGNEKVCGILENGLAMCWGSQASGGSTEDLGGLGTNDGVNHWEPAFVYGNYTYQDLEASYWGFSGVLINGSVVGWGGNYFGEIGDGTLNIMKKPTFSDSDGIYSSVSVGYSSVFGILNNGFLESWGDNRYSVLGKGKGFDIFYSPVLFQYGKISQNSYSKIYVGSDYACGISSYDEVLCWGNNDYGQLGDGTSYSRNYPKEILGNYNFSSIDLGSGHSCGLLQNGTALCWGKNEDGQVGDNTTVNRNIPTPVYGDYVFSKIITSVQHTCGILNNGTALCWGKNNNGQLGNNDSVDSYIPVAVHGDYNFSFLKGGAAFTCGLLQNGTAFCWGKNNIGQLGDNQNCGTDICLIPQGVYGNYSFSSIYSGGIFTCGLLENGTALCWGSGNNGKLGDNSNSNRYSPFPVYGNHTFLKIVSGSAHTCGILTNGSVLCWGWNSYGQIGDGTDITRLIPTSVNIDETFEDIDAGGWYSFGVLRDGRIVSWGYNGNNQQAFSSFDSRVPTGNIYWEKMFGRGLDSYEISFTFDKEIQFLLASGFDTTELDDLYNNIVLSYSGNVANIYLNGDFVKSFSPPGFSLSDDLEDIILGKNSNAEIDELRMWNRSLSDSEIEMLYRSNLMKVDNDSWTFEFSMSKVKDEYSYFAKAIFGANIWELALKKIGEVTGSTGAPSSISAGTLSAGFERFYSVGESLSFEAPEGDYSFVVSSVEEGEVTLILNGESYSFSEEERIDLDGDGDYDVEVSVDSINEAGQVELSIVIVDEPVEFEEPVVEEAWKEGLTEEEIEEVERKSNTIYWVIVGLVALVILFVVWRFIKKKK